MRPRTSFLVRWMAVSLALAAAWWAVIRAQNGWWIVENAGFCIPVLAAVFASTMSWRKKGWAAGTLAAVFLLGDAIAELSGVRAMAADASGFATIGGSVAGVLYHVFRMGVPIAALLIVVGGDVSSLWAVSDLGRDVCPVCGRRRVGLAAHVRDVHGQEVLRSLKAKGRL